MASRLRTFGIYSLILLSTTGCVRGPLGLFAALVGTAVVTAAVVSASQPPPPRVVYVPEQRPGYSWQAGFWFRDRDQWVWIEGRWIPTQPGYQWSPTHWERSPDGTWRLVPGQWLPSAPPPQ